MNPQTSTLFNQHYEFNGFLYLPKPAKISGTFSLNYSSLIEGNKIFVDGDSRDKIMGILFNTKTYCFPGAENNPRNILAFALFGDSLTNKMFYLTHPGFELDFSGNYSGTTNPLETSSIGIEPVRFRSSMCYIDQHLQNKNFNKIDLEVNVIGKK